MHVVEIDEKKTLGIDLRFERISISQFIRISTFSVLSQSQSNHSPITACHSALEVALENPPDATPF